MLADFLSNQRAYINGREKKEEKSLPKSGGGDPSFALQPIALNDSEVYCGWNVVPILPFSSGILTEDQKCSKSFLADRFGGAKSLSSTKAKFFFSSLFPLQNLSHFALFSGVFVLKTLVFITDAKLVATCYLMN